MALPLNTHTNNYVIGRGKVFFNRLVSGVSRGLRYMGNTPGFTLTVASEQVKHKSSSSGLAATDKTITLSTEFSGEITIDDMQGTTYEYAFGGTKTTLTQSATPVANEPIVVYQGSHYQLGKVSANKVGVRGVSSVTVTNTAGSTTYDLTDDYLVDADSGMIYIVEGGAITDGQTVHVDYTATAGDREIIASGTAGAVDGELVFISDNPQAEDRDVRIPLCSLAPNGDIPFITDTDFAQVSFSVGVSTLDTGTSQVYIAGRLAV